MPLIETPASRTRAWTSRAALLLFVVNAAALVYYQLVPMHDLFSSDTAIKLLVADEMLRQASPILADWNYVNGDLWLLLPNLAVLPFMPIVGLGFLAHALGGLLTAGLLFFACHELLRRLGAPAAVRWLALAALASGCAQRTAWLLYGDYTYAWVLLTALCTLLLLLRAADPDASASRWIEPAAFALAFAAHANNSERALVYATIPALAAGVLHVLASRGASAPNRRANRGGVVRFLIALGAGALAGTALHAWLLARVLNLWTAGASAFLPLTQLPTNAAYAALALVHALGGEPVAGVPLASLAGAYASFRLLLAVALLVTLWLVLRRNWPTAPPSLRLAIAFASSGMALVLFVYLTSTTPYFAKPEAVRHSVRYLLPPLVLLFLVAAAAARRGSSSRQPARVLVVAALVFALSFPAVLLPGDSALRARRKAIVDLLEHEGLAYGYATLWNASVYTALTGGALRIREIEIRQRLVPSKSHTSRRWYRRDAWEGPTFLILEPDELKQLGDKGLLDCPVRPDRRLSAAGYTILVYAQNPARHMLGWDDSDSAWDAPICLSTATEHQVGGFSDGALRTAGGESGFLLYGPYVSLAAGRYVAAIEYEASAGPIRFEAVAAKTSFAFASLPVGEGRLHAELPFELASPQENVELRVQVGGAAMAIHSVGLRRLAPSGGN